MITIQLLENNDTIRMDDWCRPLVLITMSGGISDSMSFTSEYSGAPTNNAKWTRVSTVFGECWEGDTVKNINKAMEDQPYEFARGDIPHSHRLQHRRSR